MQTTKTDQTERMYKLLDFVGCTRQKVSLRFQTLKLKCFSRNHVNEIAFFFFVFGKSDFPMLK